MEMYHFSNKNPMDCFGFILPTEIVYGPGVLSRYAIPQRPHTLQVKITNL